VNARRGLAPSAQFREDAHYGNNDYRSARAFAVNPARLTARPSRATGVDRLSAAKQEGLSCPSMKSGAPRFEPPWVPPSPDRRLPEGTTLTTHACAL